MEHIHGHFFILRNTTIFYKIFASKIVFIYNIIVMRRIYKKNNVFSVSALVRDPRGYSICTCKTNQLKNIDVIYM